MILLCVLGRILYSNFVCGQIPARSNVNTTLDTFIDTISRQAMFSPLETMDNFSQILSRFASPFDKKATVILYFTR